jgi:succinate dehydrogenase / fumarate reductase flavoprotein subunit
MMQRDVGIMRREDEMLRALEGLRKLWERARRVGVIGHREFNPGWHTALDLTSLLTVSECIARAALERKESRGAQFREDYPNKDEALGKLSIVLKKGADGTLQLRREPVPEMPAELKQVIEEMK